MTKLRTAVATSRHSCSRSSKLLGKRSAPVTGAARTVTSFARGIAAAMPCRGRASLLVRLFALAAALGWGCPAVAQDNCVPPPTPPVAWWSGDNTTNDLMGAHPVILRNGATYTPGAVGQSFAFDGANAFLEVPAGEFLYPGTNSFSVAFWLKSSQASGFATIFSHYDSAGTVGSSANMEMFLDNGRLHTYLRDLDEGGSGEGGNQELYSGRTVADGQFHFIVWQRDLVVGRMRIYIDGASDGDVPLVGPTGPLQDGDGEADSFLIGASYPGGVAQPWRFFSGQIDEFTMFHRALTSNEVATIYAAGSAGMCRPDPVCLPPPAGLVGWWSGDGNAKDLVAAQAGALLDGATFSSGMVGQGFEFAETGMVRIARAPSLDVGDGGGFTLLAWVKPRSIANQMPIFEWRDAERAGTHFWISVTPTPGSGPGCLYANLKDTGGVHHFFASAPGLVTTTASQLVALRFDRTSGLTELYLNGEVVAQTNFGSIRPDTTGDLYIGFRETDPTASFIGNVDEPAIWNRALASNEIAAIYAAGSAGMCRPEPVCLPPPAGLVGWWPGDGNANDLVGGNGGTFNNGASATAAGIVGQAFNFDGVNDVVAVPHTSSISLTNQLSIAFWAKRRRLDAIDLVLEKGGDWTLNQTTYGVGLHSVNSRMFYFFYAGGWRGTAGVDDTNWHHYAVIARNGESDPTLIVDGIERTVSYRGGTATMILQPNQASLNLGAQLGHLPYYGRLLLDEVALFDRALTSNEIATIYAAGSPGMCRPDPVCLPPPAGLVGWWSGDGNANDLVGGNHGALQNGATTSLGNVGAAFSFDGIDDGIFVNNANGVFDLTNSWTVQAWVQPSAPGVDFRADPIVWKVARDGNVPTEDTFSLSWGSGNRFTVAMERASDDFSYQLTSAPHESGRWYHVAGEYDGQSLHVFVDGTLEGTLSIGRVVAYTGPAPLRIGTLLGTSHLNAGSFDGRIDEVAVFNRALTSNEIATIYAAGSAGMCRPDPVCLPPPAGLVGWWSGDGNANDLVGGNSGILRADTTFAASQSRQAFAFDQSTDVVELGDPASLALGHSMTIGCWLYPTALPTPVNVWGLVVYRGDNRGGLDPYFLAIRNNGRVYFHLENENAQTTEISAPIPVGQWSYVVATLEDTSGWMRIYVNSVLGASTQTVVRPFAALNPANNPNVAFGNHPSPGTSGFNMPFQGMLDEAAIWNRALSSNEIAALYAAGSAGMCKPPAPPSIVGQPTNGVVNAYGSAQLAVTATGEPAPAYQWRFNGAALAGQTNAVLTLMNVQPWQAGNYDAVVSNSVGAVTSAVARVVVLPAANPVCLPPPSGLVAWWRGAEGTEVVGGLSTDMNAVTDVEGVAGRGWGFDGLSSQVTVAGASSLNPSELSVSLWARFAAFDSPGADDTGLQYLVFADGSGLFEAFSVAKLRGPEGEQFLFTVGSDPQVHARYGLFSHIPGGIQLGKWYHLAATFTQQNVELYVDGSRADVAPSPFSLGYAMGSPLVFGSSGQAFDGRLLGAMDEPAFWNRALSSNEIAALYAAGSAGMCKPPAPPSIVGQPTNGVVNAYGSAQLAVTATGEPAPAYQWRFNGAALAGQTNAVLTLMNVQPWQAGNYDVVVANSSGSVTSAVAVVNVLPASNPVCVPPPAGLVAWWPGDGNANDLVGAHVASLQGEISYSSRAFNFDGVNDFVDLGEPADLKIASSDYSISGWIKIPDSPNNAGALCWPRYPVFGFDWGYGIEVNASRQIVFHQYYLQAGVISLVEMGSMQTISTNVFHHVTAVRSQTDMRLFIDGQLDSIRPFPGSALYFQTGDTLKIGGLACGFDSFLFKGSIDELAVVNRALTSNEIAAIYAAGSAGMCRPPAVPSIVTQPTNVTLNAYGNAQLAVTATGEPAPAYQWRFNGVVLAGQTNAVLTLTNVQPWQAGNYDVVVSNSVGSVTSAIARIVVMPAANPICVPSPSGLVAWWPGDENANDLVGGNGGTLLNGAITVPTGLVQGAFDLNGANSFVQVSDSDSLRPTELTLQAWVYPRSLNGQDWNTVLSRGASGNGPLGCCGDSYYLGFYRGRLFAQTFHASGENSLVANQAVSVDVWHHIALTFSGTEKRLYLNGTLVTNVSVPSTLIHEPGVPVGIGEDFNQSLPARLLFDGKIDEAAIWNRALTSNEIAAIYAAGSAGMCRPGFNLVGNGSFESGTNPPVDSYTSLYSGDTSIDGWIVASGRVDWSGTPYHPKDGSLSAQLVGDGSAFSQTFATAIGSEYLIGFSLQPAFPTASPVTIEVSLGGSTYHAVIPVGSASTWYEYSTVITATLGQSTLKFENINGGHNGPFVDSVSVTAMLGFPTIIMEPHSQTNYAGTSATFQVEAAGIVPLRYQWRFNGEAMAGATNAALYFPLAQPALAGAYDVVVSNPLSSVTSLVATLTVRTDIPDLAVREVSLPASALAGQPVPFVFTVTNQGSGTASVPWNNALRLAADTNGGGSRALGTFGQPVALAAGASLTITQSVILPSDVFGVWFPGVTLDVAGQVFETNKANNTFQSAVSIQVTAPDLEVTYLNTAVSTGVLGQPLVVTYAVRNRGTGPTVANWSDTIWLATGSNSVAGATALRTEAVPRTLAPGEGYTNTTGVTLPFNRTLVPGGYFLLAQTDAGNAQPESNEANNLASRALSVTNPPLPDLVVRSVTAPLSAAPGQTITVTWAVTNQGPGHAVGPWTESVSLLSSNATSLAGLASFTFSNALAAGDFILRTQFVTVPIGGVAGVTRLGVTVDGRDNVFEENETNNLALGETTLAVPLTLTLQLASAQISEDATAPLRATLTRNGDTTPALTVAVTNENPGELSFVQGQTASAVTNVTIPAGQSVVGFNLYPVWDHVVDANKPVTLAASAPGYEPASAVVIVLNTDLPSLTLTAGTNFVSEGFGVAMTVTRDVVTSNALTVSLTSSSAGQLSPPNLVNIPAGLASAVFNVLAVDDVNAEASATYSIAASAPGFNSGTYSVTLRDNDVPQLTVTLSTHSVSEGAGAQALSMTVTREPVGAGALNIEPAAGDAALVNLPLRITIPGGQASRSFPVGVVNDTVVNGSRPVALGAYALAAGSGARLSEATPDVLTVTDDDGPTLKLAAALKLVREGQSPATTVTVTRNTPATNDLLVTLFTSRTNEAVIGAPAVSTPHPGPLPLGGGEGEEFAAYALVIPNGQTSATFNLISVADGTNDGNQTVTLTATATNFTAGAETVVVSDTDLPDLVVSSVGAPEAATPGQTVTLSYRVANQGLSATAGSFLTRIFLSRDAVIGDDTLVAQYRYTNLLAVSLHFDGNEQVPLPVAVGNYWVVVETDAEQTLGEVLENNNTRISDRPIAVAADYAAWVNTDVTSTNAGTAVALYGRATNSLGASIAGKAVSIHVLVRGTQRVLSATTDAIGNFATTFTPLPGEAGRYDIFATHPGVSTVPVQDTFSLLGFRANPANVSLTVIEGALRSGSVSLENQSDVPLNGLAVEVISKPANLQVSATVGSAQLAAQTSLNYTLVATTADAYGTVQLRVTTAEGLSQDINLGVSVEPLRPRLVVAPASLYAAMPLGGQAVVDFAVANLGGRESGPVTISLPAVPWMHLATTNPMPSLAPGQTNRVTLVLTPDRTNALGPYTGSLALNANNAGTSVPFNFRAMSVCVGDLLVDVVDEFTYYAEGAPHLAGARVTVRDSVTQTNVVTGVTGTNGLFAVTSLNEGYYDIEVTADKHTTHRSTQLLKAGITNEVQAFVSRQTVTYTWTVEPVELEDRYRVNIETTFEANVPAPVVTVTPSTISFLPPATRMESELTIVNHGLIAVEDVNIPPVVTETFSITPLIQKIGRLGAKESITVPVVLERRFGEDIVMPPAASGRRIEEIGLASAQGAACPCPDYSDVAAGSAIYRDFFPISSRFCESDKTIGQINYIVREYVGQGMGELDCPNIPFWLNARFAIDSEIEARMTACKIHWLQVFVRDGDETTAFVDPTANERGIHDCLPWYQNSVSGECSPRQSEELIANCLAKYFYWDGPTLCEASRYTLYTMLVVESEACLGTNSFGFLGGVKVDVTGANPPFQDAQLTVNQLKAPPSFIASAMVKSAFDDIKCPKWSMKQFNFEKCLAPLVHDDRIITTENVTVSGDVRADDQDDLLACAPVTLLTLPEHGTITEWDGHGRFTYTPACNYDGRDSFTYKVGACDSSAKTATARIAVEPCGFNGYVTFKYDCSGPRPGDCRYFIVRSSSCQSCLGIPTFSSGGASTGGDTGSGGTASISSTMFAETRSCNNPFSQPVASLSAAGAKNEPRLIAAGLQNDGVCARVKLRLEQDAVLARDGFRGTLELDNNGPSRLENVQIAVGIRSESGGSSSNLFANRFEGTTVFSAVDGSLILAGNSTGTAKWLLIPTVDAAPQVATRYFVGGNLSYRLDGNDVSVPLSEVPITVLPSPRLTLKYFHQRDVFSDDPFTPVIEPSIPYSLAVMVQNRGYGEARNFRITSAQPRIIRTDDDKGLLVDFNILATEVAGQASSPSLTATFGNIGAGQTAIGRWLLASSLQGLFIDYKATWEHIDGLGNPRLSLIDEVTIHEMNHLVQAGGIWEDGKPDFLVNQIPDDRDLPDTLYQSNGSTNPVAVVQQGSFTGALSPANLQVTLTAPMPGGWSYLRVPDPGNGLYRLTRVTRVEGTNVISLPVNTNVWTTDRTFIGLSQRPIRENILHLLDYDSPGVYTLTYEPSTSTILDTNAPSSTVSNLPSASRPYFQVSWGGRDEGPLGQPISGIAYYDIFVSVNGGSFLPWLQKTTLVSATYIGTNGSHYAFYSVATDANGNRELPPGTADAETTVSIANRPPSLTLPTLVSVDEGQTVDIAIQVSDPDVEQALTLSLLGERPPGLTLDAGTRRLNWATGEGNGPGTNVINVVVRDNDFESLSATGRVTVVVREVNAVPSLESIANAKISEGQRLTFTAHASDFDLPAQAVSYALGAGSPAGAAIGSASGVFTWRPSDIQGGVTNRIAVIASDSGTPSLSATQFFNVAVRNSSPDFVLGIGTTNVMVGQGGLVPLRLRSGLELNGLELQIVPGTATITNFSLQSVASELGGAVFAQDGTNGLRLSLAAASGQLFPADGVLANLLFDAPMQEHSSIVSLPVSDLRGTLSSGVELRNGRGIGGRVFVIGAEPMLDSLLASNSARSLVVYGRPGEAYEIQSRTNLDVPPIWRPVHSLELAGTFDLWAGLPVHGEQVFYRAVHLPSVSSVRIGGFTQLVDGQVRLRFDGVAGRNYVIEASTNLVQWQAVSTNTAPVQFVSPMGTVPGLRFFRVKSQ